MDLRGQLEARFGMVFNLVLANLYRNGHDYVGWHSDDERDLVPNCVLASLSLGETRVFKLRCSASNVVDSVELRHGDLLMMRHPAQTKYKHMLAKSRRARKERVNLSFRRVLLANS